MTDLEKLEAALTWLDEQGPEAQEHVSILMAAAASIAQLEYLQAAYAEQMLDEASASKQAAEA